MTNSELKKNVVVQDADTKAINEVRKLVLDCCRQHGGGHGGTAVGMAAVAVALWKYILRFNPHNPNWFDRDRFVLSNGHAGILQYVMLHVSGYENFTMEELKGYAAPKNGDFETICHGHPEIEIDGVEITTGPLGQGIANSVGMAIASQHHKATFNKDGHDVIASTIFCTTGDGCLQEGVAVEALSLAGHLALDNLVLIYDNNQITCDGPLEWIATEDINAKVQAMGWNVIDVDEGNTNISSIVSALQLAKSYKGKPTFINIRTTIGYNTSKANTAGAHHGTFSDEDVEVVLEQLGDKSRPTHYISPETYNYFKEAGERGAAEDAEWSEAVQKYYKTYPKEGKELYNRIHSISPDYEKFLSELQVPENIQGGATREQNAYVFNQLFKNNQQMVIGGADLWGANKLGDPSHVVFEKNNYSGRVLRYGIREHAMASVTNGISAYQKGSLLPMTATFLMFYLYAAPGVRMGALCSLPAIHIATHDSIGEGQNGPTHQPVEVDTLYRTMPNFQYMRPADSEEIIGCWKTALGHLETPSMFSLARDPIYSKVPNTCRQKASKGGYVVSDSNNAKVTLISSGSELPFANEAAQILNSKGISTRVVSMPCMRVFEQQPKEYRKQVLGTAEYTVSLEPYIPASWPKFCNVSIGMKSWGYSASGPSNYKRFGLDGESVAHKLTNLVNGPAPDERWIAL
jgi:dihydroxyacetone synthase